MNFAESIAVIVAGELTGRLAWQSPFPTVLAEFDG
jgi:hypothetical protein